MCFLVIFTATNAHQSQLMLTTARNCLRIYMIHRAKIFSAKISKISYDTFLAKFHPPHAYDTHRKSQNAGGSMGFLADLVTNEQTLMRTSIQNWFGTKTCLE